MPDARSRLRGIALPKYKYQKAAWPALTSAWIRRRLRYESFPKEFQFSTVEIHK